MKSIIFDQFVELVSTNFAVNSNDLFNKRKKTRRISEARYALYYLCHNRNIKPYLVRDYMKERGFTVSFYNMQYGVNKMKSYYDTDPDYTKTLDVIGSSINL